MVRYEFLGASDKDEFFVKGIELFRYSWQTVGDCAVVVDPRTKQAYSFSVYQINTGMKNLQFAAGRDDRDHWLFFAPSGQDAAI